MKIRVFTASLALVALAATPLRADWSWGWINACGGDNFITCMSGDIAYNQASKMITVHVTNLPVEMDVYTAVGLFSLPGAPPISYTSSMGSWIPTNGINGGGLPGTNFDRYAIGTNGIGGGFDEAAGQQEFSFTFNYDLESYSNQIGVGIHAQGGPAGCSTKMGVTSSGGVPNSGSLDPACATTTIPEPITMVLMGTGLVGIAAVRRRRGGLELVDENGEDVEI